MESYFGHHVPMITAKEKPSQIVWNRLLSALSVLICAGDTEEMSMRSSHRLAIPNTFRGQFGTAQLTAFFGTQGGGPRTGFSYALASQCAVLGMVANGPISRRRKDLQILGWDDYRSA